MFPVTKIFVLFSFILAPIAAFAGGAEGVGSTGGDVGWEKKAKDFHSAELRSAAFEILLSEGKATSEQVEELDYQVQFRVFKELNDVPLTQLSDKDIADLTKNGFLKRGQHYYLLGSIIEFSPEGMAEIFAGINKTLKPKKKR